MKGKSESPFLVNVQGVLNKYMKKKKSNKINKLCNTSKCFKQNGLQEHVQRHIRSGVAATCGALTGACDLGDRATAEVCNVTPCVIRLERKSTLFT